MVLVTNASGSTVDEVSRHYQLTSSGGSVGDSAVLVWTAGQNPISDEVANCDDRDKAERDGYGKPHERARRQCRHALTVLGEARQICQ